jgi:hypothetical protein
LHILKEYQHRLEDLKAALTNLDDTKKRLDTANNQKEQKDKSVKGIEKTLDEIERKLTQLVIIKLIFEKERKNAKSHKFKSNGRITNIISSTFRNAQDRLNLRE